MTNITIANPQSKSGTILGPINLLSVGISGKAAEGSMKLTTYLHLKPRLRINRASTLHRVHDFMVWCSETISTLPLPMMNIYNDPKARLYIKVLQLQSEFSDMQVNNNRV